MINKEYIAEIAPKYKNPWHLILMVFDNNLSREDILDIVNTFNRYTTYK